MSDFQSSQNGSGVGMVGEGVTSHVSERDACPNCGSTVFVEDWHCGDSICNECGVVQPERLIDPGEEKRRFAESGGDDPSRTAKSNPYLKQGLPTSIAKATTVTTHKSDGSKAGSGSSGLSKVQARMTSRTDKNLVAAFERINHMGHMLGLPERIMGRGKEMYAKFEDKRPRTSRIKHEGLIAAIIYMSCREEGFPRTFKELARETGIAEKGIRSQFRMLNKLLPQFKSTEWTSAESLVQRLASKISLDYKFGVCAATVAKRAMLYVEGKSPSSIASASLLVVCRATSVLRTEKDIAAAASIAPSTVRNVYRILEPYTSELLDGLDIPSAKVDAVAPPPSVPTPPLDQMMLKTEEVVVVKGEPICVAGRVSSFPLSVKEEVKDEG